jgi:regulator of nucleoside diphosphate kinase
LETELNRSIQVAADKVPPDVITMHSKACLIDLDSGEEVVYTLVFPNEADVRQDKISVLAPIGTAMLGYQVDDRFEWPVPDGVRRLQVKSVLFQPEAAGTDAEVSVNA